MKSLIEAEQSAGYMDIPPISIFKKTRCILDSSNGTSAASRMISIILITCAHKECCEERTSGRKPRAASMRLSQSATFVVCSICSPGSSWGSMGGMKTGSTTERKISESESLVVRAAMVIEKQDTQTALMWHWQRPRVTGPHVGPSSLPYAYRLCVLLTNEEP